jgi:hypothetical protein
MGGGISRPLFYLHQREELGMRKALMIFLMVFFPTVTLADDTALSPDGKWLADATYQPYKLAIFSTADQTMVKVFDIAGKDGTPSRIEGVYTDPTRDNFIVTLQDVPEYWLIATDPDAPPVYEGFVHSNEKNMKEALASSEGLFARRRIEISEPIGDLVFSPDYRSLTGDILEKNYEVIINLNVNREIGYISR